MTILVVGGGAREHAIVWKLARSNRISGLYAAPGNAGTAELATNLPIADASDVDEIVRNAVDHKVNIVFVGPETPRADGVVDELARVGIPAIGPHRRAAELESSKTFSKQFMQTYGIPTAKHRSFTDTAALTDYLTNVDGRFVVKKSGLAAGKGVLETDDRQAMIEFGSDVVRSGDSVVVEERLTGYEVSVFGISDGHSYTLLPACTDYKKAGVGGSGPNTGGMGAICPVPWLDGEAMRTIVESVVTPTYRGLAQSGLMYTGILYFGIMMTESGPMVLEYNVRLGDPEAQVLLPLIENDLVDLCDAMVNDGLDRFKPRMSTSSALGVVVAAPGYPSDYPTGLRVDNLVAPPENEALVFHAATRFVDGNVHTGGGRCFTVTGLGNTLLAARTNAYTAVKGVTFPGSWIRPDIGGRVFGN